MFNIVVTSSWFLKEMASIMAPYNITPAQYNVLRILRGSHPEALTCSALGQRLLDRTPDVTRLLNRLERSGFVCRQRAEHDRRVVEVGITETGLDLLNKMQEKVDNTMDRLAQCLSQDEHVQLNHLLERLRQD